MAEQALISVEGGGFQQPDARAPIDIQGDAVVEWLVDRGAVPAGNAKALSALRKKTAEAAAALQELPAHSEAHPRVLAAAARVLQSLSQKQTPPYGSQQGESEDAAPVLGYAACKEVMDALLEVEPNTKTFFTGKYNSPLLQTWNEILQAYERGNLNLVEQAEIITDICKFEIPVLKKEAQQTRGRADELAKKAEETLKSAAEYRAKFQSQCNQLKITGKDTRKELRALSNELNDIFAKIAATVQAPGSGVLRAYELYQGFTAFSQQRRQQKEQPDSAAAVRSELRVLDHVTRFGNDAFCKVGSTGDEQQQEQQEQQQQDQQEQQSTGGITIDWGDLGSDPTPAPDAAAPASIEWDLGEDIALGSEIEAGIEVVDEGGNLSPGEKEKGKGTSGSRDTIMQSAEGRAAFVADLTELQGFLTQRLSELTRSDPVEEMLATTSFHTGMPPHSAKDVGECLNEVRGVLGELAGERVQYLLELKDSDLFVERIASRLDALASCANNLETSASDMQAARTREMAAIPLLLERQRAFTAKAKRVIPLVEKGISALYDNRLVTIVL
eukprot:TRINITY_DN7621_c0_g1_i1.p1 TRINITY_DN7621_c0_g1~~TRINITY_DN7621_c0_g1_i1.p1  ORF type:complete len:568 (-),score=174.45 TRINITY_DN7621_c0_g1_i1:62-1735(-)